MAGYSGTPLFKKLGLKPGMRLYVKNAPDDYWQWIEPALDEISVLKRLGTNVDMVHLFTLERRELESNIPSIMQKIKNEGMIWVSWPKKASKVPTDVTEDVIREVILPLGLVDVKVCAVSDVWSALKVVIRKENRKQQ
ncbi:MAG: DUF3052 family protein [Reinekea sp.]|nr:DUF3052 family protein [Reinekea sp.]